MAKIMRRIAVISAVLTALFFFLYGTTESGLFLTLAITAGTTLYHFLMRLLVGKSIHLWLQNRVNYRRKWFRVSAAEQAVYKLLRVRHWKGKMATFDPSFFDSRLHSWEEIAQATCQAELVHEVIIPLSFLPLLMAIPFGVLLVFAATSVLAACYDALFVILQRYNRPRILKLIEKVSDKK